MYAIQLDQFEGPLDLLLFFVRRDEVDLYDIPIAKIADEYLAVVRLMEEIDLDGVGDFIYMAAVLINIKARMLLPTQEVDEEGEPIDPRKELIDRLLEYVQYKEASLMLGEARAQRAEHFVGRIRQDEVDRDVADPVLEDTTVYALMVALADVLKRIPEESTYAIRNESYTIEEQTAFLSRALLEAGRLSFRRLMVERVKAFVIASFLAVLEMVRRGEAKVLVSASVADFYVVLPETQ